MNNKYLEKIAQTSEKKKSGFILAGLPSAMAGVTVSGLAGGRHVAKMTSRTRDAIHNTNSYSDAGTIKKMIRDNKLNVTMNSRIHNIKKHLSGGGPSSMHAKAMASSPEANPAFSPTGNIRKKTKDFVVGVRHFGKVVNKDIIMHELGHAKDMSTFRKLKVGSTVAGKLGGIAAPLMLSHEKTKDYAAPLAAVSVLPTLRNEAMANVHAYKGIKAHKGAVAAKSFAKKLLPNQMGAYLGSAAISAGGVYLGKKILDRIQANKSKNNLLNK